MPRVIAIFAMVLNVVMAFQLPSSSRSMRMSDAKTSAEPAATYRGAVVTDGPSADPCLTCFLAPDWMGVAPDKWVCVPLSRTDAALHADDSY